ncbi:MAG: hypothetical protein COA97_05950 [Flavobacteriales bacterium]|nr:MAG: hypothetical protein COA97_05950 [Flavobacteriales bacterium]
MLNGCNIYFRFAITPNSKFISLRKTGLNKSTIIYDIKLNEKRNLPRDVVIINECKVKSCFCFNILPNNFSFDFFDAGSLRSVRTLEYEKFNNYLNDKRVKDDELIVVFNF